MKIIEQTKDAQRCVQQLKEEGKKVGFVPTMGALHQGHLSLVDAASKSCDVVVVSIFVNPTQFNDPSDLQKYPRTLEADLNMLSAKADIVFTPTAGDIYPEEPIRYLDIDLGVLDKVMEGAHRPGHFAGVALVVHKLFEAIPADVAFFGEKDYQQVAVIRAMVKQMKWDIEIATCPTVREKDGLAMSSRNMRLSEQHRQEAPIIAKTLKQLKSLVGKTSIQEAQTYVQENIERSQILKLEYFQIADKHSLLPAQNWNTPNGCVGCIAVWAGDVRLIDNIELN